jgi:hypothetical protein
MAYGIPYSMHLPRLLCICIPLLPEFSPPGVPTTYQLVLIKRRHVLPQEGFEGHRGAGSGSVCGYLEGISNNLAKTSLPPETPAGIRSQVWSISMAELVHGMVFHIPPCSKIIMYLHPSFPEFSRCPCLLFS